MDYFQNVLSVCHSEPIKLFFLTGENTQAKSAFIRYFVKAVKNETIEVNFNYRENLYLGTNVVNSSISSALWANISHQVLDFLDKTGLTWDIDKVELVDNSIKITKNRSDHRQYANATLRYVIRLLSIILKDDTKPLILVYPEFFLHPRVQAELGSLLIEVAQKRQVIVDSQSDFMQQRIIADIRDNCGKYKAADLMILEFYKDQINRIRIDSLGNVLAPDNYRKFFTKECGRVLGI